MAFKLSRRVITGLLAIPFGIFLTTSGPYARASRRSNQYYRIHGGE
jgi:hypothetical protein